MNFIIDGFGRKGPGRFYRGHNCGIRFDVRGGLGAPGHRVGRGSKFQDSLKYQDSLKFQDLFKFQDLAAAACITPKSHGPIPVFGFRQEWTTAIGRRISRNVVSRLMCGANLVATVVLHCIVFCRRLLCNALARRRAPA